MRKKSFVLYCDYLEHVQKLDDFEAGALFKAILQYASLGTVEKLSGAPGMAFSFIKAQIDRDSEEYARKCERLRENGKKGGRPRENEKAKDTKAKQKDATETKRFFEIPNPGDNDTDNVNVNDIDTDTDTFINNICSLLNQAKKKKGGNAAKGILKPNGFYEYDSLIREGISESDMLYLAQEMAESGENIDWLLFANLLRKNKREYTTPFCHDAKITTQ